MLKFEHTCKVCQEGKKNPKLIKDIYNSKAFLKTSELSLKRICEEYNQIHGRTFSYESIVNHAKKHQFMSEEDFTQRHLKKIAKTAEKSILARKIESMQVWDKVIDEGMDRLSNGTIQLKTGDLLRAAKDKSDFELKTKDQQLAMMEMVMHFASGENNGENYERRTVIEGAAKPHINPAEELTDSFDTGEDGPSGVYYPPAWDAAA